MRRTSLFALSLLTLQGAMMAGEGKAPSSLRAPAALRATGHATPKSGPLTYAVPFNDFLGQFGVLDIGSGVFLQISELPHSAQGIGKDAEGRIYVVDQQNNLVRVNPGNGKTRVIGSTGVTTPGPLGPVLVDVFASLADGELFLMDYSNNLYSVNPKTGGATLIGATGIPPIISPLYSSSLAGDCDTLFFTISEADEDRNPLILPTLYRIDPRTGVATLTGPTASFVAGAGFVDGTLYGFRNDLRLIGRSEPPHALSIDTATGAATVVSDLTLPSAPAGTLFVGVGGAVGLAPSHPGRCKSK